MKRKLLSLLLAVITTTAFAQVGTISVTVTSSIPITGLTSIDYEFTGIEGRTYTLTVEVDFDYTADYQTIQEADLAGDYPSVSSIGTTFSGTIVWDGAASFPDRYHEQTIVRISAQLVLSENEMVDIDGNIYPTVIIGNQEWMAENLRVTKYKNGDAIPTGLSNTDWGATTSGAYAIFLYTHGDAGGINSPEEMVAAYGKLYNWHAVNTGNLCPTGWSVPSSAQWDALVNYVVSQGYSNSNATNGAGNALKSCRQIGSTVHVDCNTSVHPRWNTHTTNFGLDVFDFAALPGGHRASGGTYGNLGGYGWWWTTTETGSNSWARRMVWADGDVTTTSFNRNSGVSIRCVRD